MCSVAVRAGRERGAGRGRQGARASEGAKEELPARHGRGSNLTAIWKVDIIVLFWPVLFCVTPK